MFGTVKWFDQQKGFGFIVKQPMGGDVFVHIKQVRDRPPGAAALLEGDEVDFDTTTSEKGERAANVVLLRRVRKDPSSLRQNEPDYAHD
jgi:CspA family cold shock protein